MSKRIATLLAVALSASLAGCSSTGSSGSTSADASMKAVNKTCCCGAATDGKTTRTYNSQTLGFCSPQCADYFGKATEADKAKLTAKATGTAR